MSCGLGSPSTTVSPFSTCSPSNTMIWRYFGISSSCSLPSACLMIRRCLPLVSLPKLTMPETSARTAGSFGLRASNRSATRGRPPVMSRVFDASCGILATTSPTPTAAPSCRFTIERGGSRYCAGRSVPGMERSLPFLSTMRTIGRRSLPCEPRRFGSVISREARPVSSSVFSMTVTPSMKSMKRMKPATSDTIGWLCGSQFATVWPALIDAPSLTWIVAP